MIATSKGTKLGRKERIQVRTRYIRLRVPSEPSRTRTYIKRYRVLSFSLFNEDVQMLDSIVAKLRIYGESKANRSMAVQRAIRAFSELEYFGK